MVKQQEIIEVSKENVLLPRTSYDASIEKDAKGGDGYKGANLKDLEKSVQEFYESEEGKRERQLLKEKHSIELGVSVPPFQIENEHELVVYLDKYVPQWRNDWQEFIDIYNNQTEKGSLSSESERKLEGLTRRIEQTFKNHTFETKSLTGADTYMIRSSGKHEDKADMANPGGNVSNTSNNDPVSLSINIGESLASYFSPKSITQRLAYNEPNITELPSSGVIKQALVGEGVNSHEQVVSGVIYTFGNGVTVVQAAPGHGKKVVESKGRVDTYHTTKDGVITERIEPKETRFKVQIKNVNGRQKTVLEEVENSAELKYSSSLNQDIVRVLHKLSLFLENKDGMPLDIEFVYSKKDNTVYVVQKRAKSQNNNIIIEPSTISPKFLSANKANPNFHTVNALQVITPAINRATVISDPKQVIFADNCDQALSQYNNVSDKSTIKAIIVQTQEAELSHASGFFLAQGLAVMQVAKTEEVKILLQQNPDSPLIVDPQHSRVYQLPPEYQKATEETLYQPNQKGESVLTAGIYSSSLPNKINASKYEFSNIDMGDSKTPLPLVPLALPSILQALETKKLGDFIAESEAKNSESAHLLFSLMHHALSWQQIPGSTLVAEDTLAPGDKARALRDNMNKLADIPINQNAQGNKEALGYILRASMDSYKKGIISKELFDTSMVIGANLFLLLNRMEKLDPSKLSKAQENQRCLEYFDLQQQFNAAITGYGDSLASSLKNYKYVKLAETLNPYIEGDAKNILIKSLKLGKNLLNKDFVNKESYAAWNKFCANICTTDENAKKLNVLLDTLTDYDAHEQWLNYVFADVNDPRDPKQTLANLLKDFKDLEQVLPKIQQASGLIKSLESQLSNWTDPNKFEELYKNLEASVQVINQNLKWNSKCSNLEKILITQQIHKLGDTIDKSIKSLKGSSLYNNMEDKKGNNLKAARVLSMQKPFLKLMINCIENVSDQYDSKTKGWIKERLNILTNLLDKKSRSKLIEEELFPSAGFIVNTAILDIPSGAWTEPKTLEDIYTAIHQNLLKFLGRATTPLNKIIEPKLPPIVQTLNSEINSYSSSRSFSGMKVPTIMTVNEGKLLITKNLPLRAHSAEVKLEYDMNTNKTLLKYSCFGADEEKRGEQILVSSKIAFLEAECPIISQPHVRDDMMIFEVEVNNLKQAEVVAKEIDEANKLSNSLGYNGELYIDIAKGRALVQKSLERLDALYNKRPNEVKEIYCLPFMPISYEEFRKVREHNPSRAYFIAHYQPEFKDLAEAGLTPQKLLEIYDKDPRKASFLVRNSTKIKHLAGANLAPDELLTLYDTNFERTKFLVDHGTDIENLAEVNLSYQELLNIRRANPKRASFLLNHSVGIWRLAKANLWSYQELLNIYDTNPTRATLLVNNSMIIQNSRTPKSFSDEELLKALQRKAKEFLTAKDNETDIEILSKAGLDSKKLSQIYEASPRKALYLRDTSSNLRSLTKVGMPIGKWLEMYDIDSIKAQFFADNGWGVECLSKAGISMDQLSKMYDEDPIKAQFFADNGSGIECLSEAGVSIKQLSKTRDTDPIKAQFFAKNGNSIKHLSEAGISIDQLSKMYDENPIKAQFFAGNNNCMEIFFKLGLPSDQSLAIYETNPKKAQFFSKFYYHNIEKIPFKLDIMKELPTIYDNNPEKAKFLAKIYHLDDFREMSLNQINGLKDSLQQELRQIYDKNPEKAEFFWKRSFEMRELSKCGLLPQELFTIYDNDPNCASSITHNCDSIQDKLKKGILTGQDLTKCNLKQLTQLINGKITPEQLKESLSKDRGEVEQVNKMLKRAAEIGNTLATKTMALGATRKKVPTKEQELSTKQPTDPYSFNVMRNELARFINRDTEVEMPPPDSPTGKDFQLMKQDLAKRKNPTVKEENTNFVKKYLKEEADGKVKQRGQEK